MINTYKLIILVVFISLSSCALSPQVIIINPDLKIDSTLSENRTTTIGLDVVDARSSNIIGQRGGVYKETSNISTDDNMTSNLERRLAKALNDFGFHVVDKGKEAVAILTVRIMNINYIYHSDKVLNNIETRAEIQAVCRMGDKEYTGLYKSTRKKDVLKTPDEEGNSKIVNEVIAVVLQQMLKDNDLISFLDG